MTNPWEQPETAISSGLDPYSVSERSARRRTGDAGLGRGVVVPVYVRGSSPVRPQPYRAGLLVRLAPGGGVSIERDLFPPNLGGQPAFWAEVHRASEDGDAVVARDGWSRVVVGGLERSPGVEWSLVLRSADWALVRSALELQRRPRSAPQDAPVERVIARFLGRLDGLDGTTSEGLWGRLALEVVRRRHPDRLADATSLRWHASWGLGGFGAGSGGRADGSAGSSMLLALRQQRVDAAGRPFRVRTLPDWEREQAANDLGLSPLALLAWPVSPLTTLLAFFDDIVPAPPPSSRTQDAPLPARSPSGPQDAR